MAAKRASKKKPAAAGAEGDDRTSGPSFDEGLEQLEALVAELEDGDLSLEDSIERYTVGVDLLKRCHEALAAHRRRVEELTRDAESTLAAFEADPDFDGEAGDGDAGSGQGR